MINDQFLPKPAYDYGVEEEYQPGRYAASHRGELFLGIVMNVFFAFVLLTVSFSWAVLMGSYIFLKWALPARKR